MRSIIIGFDTETCDGPPISFQFYSDFGPANGLIFIENQSPSQIFFDYLNTLPDNECDYILFAHNLKFDLGSAWYDWRDCLYDKKFEASRAGWDIDGLYADLVWVHMKRGRQRVHILDTGAFYEGKLERLAQLFCPRLPKLDPPDGPDVFGKKQYRKTDTDFCAYAMRDAEIAYEIGKKIIELHLDYDIPLAVSISDLSAKVFRRHYLRKPMVFPGVAVYGAAWQAYRGGKNNLTVTPGEYDNVTCLDINSAYPHAMSQFPGFSDPQAYQMVKSNGFTSKIPPELGVYLVTGSAKPCRWAALYRRGEKNGPEALTGDFSRIWVQGYELAEAMRSGEASIRDLYGYCYIPNKPEYSPLAAFVTHFYTQKQSETDPIKRENVKAVLNHLSGKFIQTIKRDLESTHEFCLDSNVQIEHIERIAGGLYHPFIGAAITGHCRARIHQIEHQTQALHTATDGVFTQNPVNPSWLSKKLGGLKIEAEGKIVLVRNKCYVFYDNSGNVVKAALHGFRGTVDSMVNLIKTRPPGMEYPYTRCNSLRESRRRKLVFHKFDSYLGHLKTGGKYSHDVTK